ncbi:MAG: HAD domain-containing protein, partial [Pseudomonas neustonica]
MLLFLDYDGVLHPDEVFLLSNGRVELRADGSLFMWAPTLMELISDLDVQVVLSTSWVRYLGFKRARKALP